MIGAYALAGKVTCRVRRRPGALRLNGARARPFGNEALTNSFLGIVYA